MTEIKIKHKDTLTESQYQKILNNPKTVNLGKDISDAERLERREERKTNMNFKIKLAQKGVIAGVLLIIGFIAFSKGDTPQAIQAKTPALNNEELQKVGKVGVVDKRVLKRMNYAYKLGYNLEVSEKVRKHTGLLTKEHIAEAFVLTLNAENGLWSWSRQSPVNGNGFRDEGLCQLNRQWHAPFITSEDFKNPYKQLDYCIEVFKKGLDKMERLHTNFSTTFYGYNKRENSRKYFTFK